MPVLNGLRESWARLILLSSNSPTSPNSPGSSTPGSPLSTTLNTESTSRSSMPTSALPTQAETQSPEDIPTLPTSSTSSPLPVQPSSSNNSTALITTLQPYSPSLRHQKKPTNIAKFTFRTHDLPLPIYIGGQSLPVRPYQPPPHHCQNCWRFGDPAKHCRSTDRCPICAQPEPHPTLNTCTGTVSLSPANCPVDTKNWSDCVEDLLGCLKDQDVKSVHCYCIPPKGHRKKPTNIAKITFSTHDLPIHPYAICAQPGHNRSNCSAQTRTCANCGDPHYVFYRDYPTYKSESEFHFYILPPPVKFFCYSKPRHSNLNYNPNTVPSHYP
ncbi:uncharacterized protein [Penaeus vannamei]|uniref:uncharacterized protein n=1 Tax=Penaeus vannamei TaxID=6689 RepID=UPI00387F49C6